MSNGFKVALLLVTLLAISGAYFLFAAAPSATLSAEEEARGSATLRVIPKKAVTTAEH